MSQENPQMREVPVFSSNADCGAVAIEQQVDLWFCRGGMHRKVTVDVSKATDKIEEMASSGYTLEFGKRRVEVKWRHM